MPYFEGSLSSKIAIIGEAPGYDEVRLDRPFVGSSGKELNNLLASAGIPRQSCYLTNVIKVRPPNNDIKAYIDVSRKKPIITQTYVTHEKALRKEMEKCEANVIITLGNTPLYALTGLTKVTKRRGSVLRAKPEYGERKVICSLHPAFALRNYLSRWYILADLTRAKEESLSPEIHYPTPNLILDPTCEEALSYIRSIQVGSTIGIDIEVFSSEVSHLSIAKDVNSCICIPFFTNGYNRYNEQEEADLWIAISDLLHDDRITKIGQNITFDFTFLYERYGIVIHNLYDTMIAMGILYPDFPKGLDFICSMFTDFPYYKDEGKKWFKMSCGDDMSFRHYNALDSLVCLISFHKLIEQIKNKGLLETYKRQCSLVEPLVYISSRGISMNTFLMQEEATKNDNDLLSLTEEFYRLCNKPFSEGATFHNSAKQLKFYFYGERGYAPYHFKGAITCNETALKRLSIKGCKEAGVLLKIRKLSKLNSTYLKMRLDRDNRLRCSMNPVGTSSGRLSSSKTIFGTGANMQNQPPIIKRCMLADDGYILIDLDKATAENRVVAYVANERTMIHAFEEGIDLHKLTASLIFNKPIEEVSDKPGSCDIGGGLFSERFWGKKANHGLNYDLGYKTFALYYEITEREAKRIVEAYHKAYPAIRRWHKMIQEQLRKNRIITSCAPFNRPKIFLDRWGDALFKSAYSYIPQSTVVDIVNTWGVQYSYYDLSRDSSFELLNQVHDSVVAQMKVEEGPDKIAEKIHKLLTNLNKPVSFESRSFVIPTDVKIGYNCGKKDKDNPRGMVEIPRKTAEDLTSLANYISDYIGETNA